MQPLSKRAEMPHKSTLTHWPGSSLPSDRFSDVVVHAMRKGMGSERTIHLPCAKKCSKSHSYTPFRASSVSPPSPSPSPGPAGNANGRSPNFRASMGPGAARPPSGINQGLSPASPRPGAISGAGRPTSELLGSAGLFQTPEGTRLATFQFISPLIF